MQAGKQGDCRRVMQPDVTKYVINCYSFYSNWDEDAYHHYMAMFGLDEGKKPMELSEGMKVKFNLLLALSHRAEVLILDEPTSGLDPFSRDELMEVFQILKEHGVTIFFSTHIISDLERCADNIILENRMASLRASGSGISLIPE